MFRILFCFLIIVLNMGQLHATDVISVLYIENTTNNEEYQWLHKGLADMIISDLKELPGIKIVERESLQKILNEHALSLTGLMDTNPSDLIGKLVQADKLVYGAYIIHGPRIRIDMKISEVKNGRILDAFKVEGQIDEIFELQKKLVGLIKSSLNFEGGLLLQKPDTRSVSALEKYYNGIDHLDNGRFDKARVEFTAAKELDPFYLKAQEGLAEAYKFLKSFKIYRQQDEITNLYQKLSALNKRLENKDWITYADIVQSARYRSLTPQEQQAFNERHNEYLICNTPSQCTWHIMLTMEEIGRKSVEYFSDTGLQAKMLTKVIELGDQSRQKFEKDNFLSELLYVQILALYSLKDFEKLKKYAEEFLMKFPDFRMIESVENYYEEALKALSQVNE